MVCELYTCVVATLLLDLVLVLLLVLLSLMDITPPGWWWGWQCAHLFHPHHPPLFHGNSDRSGYPRQADKNLACQI